MSARYAPCFARCADQFFQQYLQPKPSKDAKDMTVNEFNKYVARLKKQCLPPEPSDDAPQEIVKSYERLTSNKSNSN